MDQRFDTDDVLLAGQWLGDFEQWIGDDTPGPNCGGGSRENSGQTDAAGHASIISGTDETGARVVLFGTEPMFRDHPRSCTSRSRRRCTGCPPTSPEPAARLTADRSGQLRRLWMGAGMRPPKRTN